MTIVGVVMDAATLTTTVEATDQVPRVVGVNEAPPAGFSPMNPFRPGAALAGAPPPMLQRPLSMPTAANSPVVGPRMQQLGGLAPPEIPRL